MAAIKNQLDQEYDKAGREFENENKPEQVLAAESLIARAKTKKEKLVKPTKPRAKVSEVRENQEA